MQLCEFNFKVSVPKVIVAGFDFVFVQQIWSGKYQSF